MAFAGGFVRVGRGLVGCDLCGGVVWWLIFHFPLI